MNKKVRYEKVEYLNKQSATDFVRNLDEEDLLHLETLRHLYIELDMTSKEVCSHYGVQWTTAIRKLFFKVFPKNKGWGGARKGAGNNKHLNKTK